MASCNVFTGAVCQVTVTNTVCVMLPSQPNLVESNSALLPSGDSMWNSFSNGSPFCMVAISVPSFGARLYRWLASASPPAPGMFLAMTAGRPGM